MKTLKLISADDIIRWHPCYPPERIRELLPEPVTPLDACDLRRFRAVSTEDRLWVLLREDIIPASLLRHFAADCAERALIRERKAGREPDVRSWEAVAVARRYADGQANRQQLDAAWAAARDAAWDAWDAARDAAGAADAAAWAAARDAAWDAAEAAETRWQLKRLTHYLANQEKTP